MRKLIKSRKEYTCYECKKIINKKEMYSKKSFSAGKPNQPDKIIRTSGGGIAFEMQGIRWNEPICEKCTINETAFRSVKLVELINNKKEIKK